MVSFLSMVSLPAEYDLNSNVHDGYVYARVRTPALTPEVAAGLLRELRVVLIDARKFRLMMEYEVAFALTDEEAEEFVKMTATTFPGIRIAFVAADSRHAPSLSMGAALANYSGGEYGFFTKAEDADEWLLTEED